MVKVIFPSPYRFLEEANCSFSLELVRISKR